MKVVKKINREKKIIYWHLKFHLNINWNIYLSKNVNFSFIRSNEISTNCVLWTLVNISCSQFLPQEKIFKFAESKVLKHYFHVFTVYRGKSFELIAPRPSANLGYSFKRKKCGELLILCVQEVVTHFIL